MHNYFTTSSANDTIVTAASSGGRPCRRRDEDDNEDGGGLTLTVPVDDEVVDRALVRLPLRKCIVPILTICL